MWAPVPHLSRLRERNLRSFAFQDKGLSCPLCARPAARPERRTRRSLFFAPAASPQRSLHRRARRCAACPRGSARARNAAPRRLCCDVCGVQSLWVSDDDAGRRRLNVRPGRYGRAERGGAVVDARRGFDQFNDHQHQPDSNRCNAASLGAAVSRRWLGRDCRSARGSLPAAVRGLPLPLGFLAGTVWARLHSQGPVIWHW